MGSKENAMSDNAKDSYIHIYLLQSNLRDSIRLVVGRNNKNPNNVSAFSTDRTLYCTLSHSIDSVPCRLLHPAPFAIPCRALLFALSR